MNKTYFFNYIRFYKWGIGINTWKIKQRIFSFIIKRRIKFIDNFFKKRSACYHETLIDSEEMFYHYGEGEKEILKEQIKHLDGIIKVLEDCKKRNLNLKEVRRERGWLAEYLKDAEIEIKKGKYYYGKERTQSQIDRHIKS